jgi:hypothetical protein
MQSDSIQSDALEIYTMNTLISSLLRRVIVGLILITTPVSMIAQGEVAFVTANGRLDPVNARVTFEDGTPVGSDFTGQLYGGPAGTPSGSLQPLFPTYVFQPNGYIDGGQVPVPGVEPGDFGTLMLRAYNGISWETSLVRGESDPIIIQLSGGALPPAYMVGLQGFTVHAVPEPSSVAIMTMLGVILITFRRRKAGRKHLQLGRR